MYKRQGDLNPRAKEFVQTISSNGLKILTLIDNFLTSCKIDAGKLAIYPRDVNLQYLIEDLITMFQVELERNHLSLETKLAEGLPSIRGDESLLYRAMANVFSNACKFTPPEGTITLRTSVLEAARSPLERFSVKIEVSNTGPGIPSEDLDSIFDKFRRSPAHSGVEGTGIGSYVLQRVIEAHGGTVSAASVPNSLTTFSILLPVEANT